MGDINVDERIKMDLKETEYEGVGQFKVVQASVRWCYECDNHTLDFIKAGNSFSS